MDQKEQIKLAFEIYERIARLENALWGQYYKEFLEIIMIKKMQKPVKMISWLMMSSNLIPEK